MTRGCSEGKKKTTHGKTAEIFSTQQGYPFIVIIKTKGERKKKKSKEEE